MNSNILNIVQFKVTDTIGADDKFVTTDWNQAAVFYADGTVKVVDVDTAKDLAKSNGVLLQETTAEGLTKNYNKFRSIANFDPNRPNYRVNTDGKAKPFTFVPNNGKAEETPVKSSNDEEDIKTEPLTVINGGKKPTTKKASDEETTAKTTGKKKADSKMDDSSLEEDVDIEEEEKRTGFLGLLAAPFVGLWRKFKGVVDGVNDKIKNRAAKKLEKKANPKEKIKDKIAKKKDDVVKGAKDFADSAVKEHSKGSTKKTKVSTKKAKKKSTRKGFFGKVAAAITAVAVALGLVSCASGDVSKQATPETASQTLDLTDEELNELTDEELVNLINSGEISLEQVKEMLASGAITNEVLDNLSFDQLLAVTNSEVQASEMSKIGNYLEYFNGTFADKYLENNHKDVRAALSWEEVMALNLAYNDFTKDEIKAMINGTEFDSLDLTNAYKEGTLQLMGAFVLETRDMPVDLSQLLNSQEGIDFYNKYNDLFLRCKETTGQEQIDAVNAFYQELYKDFPITSEVREVGISHSEARDDIVSYKLSITPMVAAAEMMFQNLEIDHTMADPAINYFNDLGLCNYAQGVFDKVENLSYCMDEDKSLPTYEQFASAKIEKLKAEDHYFSSDRERDLSQLDLFQDWVNGHFNLDGNGEFIYGSTVSENISYEVVGSYTTTSTSYSTDHSAGYGSRGDAVKAVGEAEVERQEGAIQDKYDKENAAAKAEGEAEAEKNRQELQDQADKDAEAIRDEIKQDEEDLQDKIDDANDTINNGGQVNEDDFGDHNVDFDNNHSSSDGTLDDSVSDVTTDGTGVGEELPDPDQSGSDFDANEPSYSGQPEGTLDVGTTPDGDVFIEYEEPVIETATTYSEPTTTYSEPVISNDNAQTQSSSSDVETLVDDMVEEMAAEQTEDEAFVYTK